MFLAAILSVVALGQAAETVDYAYWAGCKVGSWTRHRIESKIEDATLTVDWTRRLVEVTPEAVTLEVVSKSFAADTLFDVSTSTLRIPSKAAAEPRPEKTGEEEIEVLGRKLKCRWMETGIELDGVPQRRRIWMSPEVPGGVVKSEGGPAGLKEPVHRLRVLEWLKVGPGGAEEVTTRKEAEDLFNKVGEKLLKAKSLQFRHTTRYGTQATSEGSVSVAEGNRINFSFTYERKTEKGFARSYVSDGTTFRRASTGGTPFRMKTPGHLGETVVSLFLSQDPLSIDPWFLVEQGVAIPATLGLSTWRVLKRERRGEIDTVVLEYERDANGAGKRVYDVLLWIDAKASLPLRRSSHPREAKSIPQEETFSDFKFDGVIELERFKVPEKK